MSFDPKKIAADLQWLKDHPEFEEKPASIIEFLGEDYLNIEKGVRPGVKQELIELFGEEANGKRIALVRWAMFTGAIGIGKGLPVTSSVHTPTGWKAIGVLQPGDFVTGSDGQPTKVLGVYPRGVLPTYDVNFSDGTYLRVDGDHLWTVEKKHGRDRKIVRETVETRELMGRKLKYEGNGWIYNIPMVEPVHYQNEDKQLAIQPYLMGLLLGDGCLTRGTITLAGDDFEVEDYVELPEGVRMERSKWRDWRFVIESSKQRSWNSNNLLAILRAYDLAGVNSHEKFIPDDYMQSNPYRRLELLRGLMDADGGMFGRNSCRFSNSNLHLCEQVLDIVQSLGGTGSIGSFSRRGTTEYWVAINLPVNPFKISRKADAWKPRQFKKPMRYITSVVPSGEDHIVCIKVDAEDQLFVAEDYIVTHNTTMASIIIPYMVHWVLCLKSPQDYYDLLPGSKIAFMQMSTTEDQAKETVFGDIKARIQYSPWFQNNYPYDPSFKNQIRFSKDIWILPGNSAETTFEGYNILGGILDEADSHKVTPQKDYAEAGWDTINSRIDSRFQDRGFLLVVGQMKKSSGFAAAKYKELKDDPENAHTVRMTIWESLGWHKFLDENGNKLSFYYDTKRKEIVHAEAARLLGYPEHILEIPKVYEKNFRNNPEKALRDLAGIPPAAGSAFISMTHKIEDAVERWVEKHGKDSPVSDDPIHPVLADWFVSTTPLKRSIHLDIGLTNDAAGIVMGHVSHLVRPDDDDDLKPYIEIDCIIRCIAPKGQEVILSDLRRYIYELKNRGFRIKDVSMDGFQCFTGDTLVPLLDGRTLSIQELAEKYPDGGVWTYSFNGKKIVPGKVVKAWRTAKKHTIKVGLDNGEVIRCTPDHLFMLRNGEYKEACLLSSGDSLMPLYRRTVTMDTGHMDQYEQVAQITEFGTRWQYTHRLVAGQVPEGYVIHHDDENHFNNSPENLKIVTRGEHTALHHTVEHWTPERRESVGAAISKSNSELTDLLARRRRLDVTIADLEAVMHLSRRAIAEKYGWSQDMIYARVREAGYSGWADFKKNYVPNNHQVAFVDFDLIEEDVYDLQIEDHHNFALDAGVIVHNSTDTRQQLRKKRFHTEYLSIDKSKLPYEDLRDALYEDRIAIPPYLTYLHLGDTKPVQVAVKELFELEDDGKKVDHPANGSKDCADGIAGVTTTLMGDRAYRRNIGSRQLDTSGSEAYGEMTGTDRLGHAAFSGGQELRAPIPDTNVIQLFTPPSLRR